MARPKCEKCEAVRSFIQRQRENPPKGLSFEVIPPYEKLLDDILKILDRKSPLDLMAEGMLKIRAVNRRKGKFVNEQGNAESVVQN